MTENSSLGYVPSGYNYIINPAFEVNQRGVASVNTSGAFAVDMWKNSMVGSTNTVSQQSFTIGQTDVPGEPTNYLRNVVVSSAGATNYARILHAVEGVRILAGQIATLSFYAKADAAKPIALEFVQNFGTGGSTQVTTFVAKPTLTTSWAKYSFTVDVPSISGKTIGTAPYFQVAFWLDAGSDFNVRTNTLGQQSGTFEFANVKLEAGSIATPFRVPTYAEELQKCMRYLKGLGGNVAYEILTGGLGAASTTVGKCVLQLDPPMRATPTVIAPSNVANFALYDLSGGGAIAVNGTIAVDSVVSGPRILVLAPPVASGLTQYRPYALVTNNQTTDKLILSAEL